MDERTTDERTDAAPRRPGPSRGLVVRRRRAVLAFALVGAVVAAITTHALVRPPTWYAPPRASDEAAVELAELVEYRLAEELQAIRPEAETWWIRLREDQVNAWLARRLPAWLVQEGRPLPEGTGPPQVRVRPGGVDVALRRAMGPLPAGVSARLEPSVAGGELTVRISGVRLGRLPADTDAWIARALAQAGVEPDAEASPDGVRFERPQGAEAPVGILRAPARVRLTDGRHVELLELRFGDGELAVACRTVR